MEILQSGFEQWTFYWPENYLSDQSLIVANISLLRLDNRDKLVYENGSLRTFIFNLTFRLSYISKWVC